MSDPIIKAGLNIGTDKYLSFRFFHPQGDLEHGWCMPRQVRIDGRFVESLLMPVLFRTDMVEKGHSRVMRIDIDPPYHHNSGGHAEGFNLSLGMAEWMVHFIRTIPCIVLIGPRDIGTIRADIPLLTSNTLVKQSYV